MSHTDHIHLKLPEWGYDAQQRGQKNAHFLAELAAHRPDDYPQAASRPPFRRVGLCGAGIMGGGIAAVNVQHGVPTSIFDAASSAVDQTVANLRRQMEEGRSSNEPGTDNLELLIKACYDQQALADCDLVIESAVENRELKHQILERLNACLAEHAILTSNTSTISIDALAKALPNGQRFCGLHFCNPVPKRRLVEIVRGTQTTDETIAAAVRYVVRIGKLPIVVRDRPGFLVNRLLFPYLNEALEMICQGADLQALDTAGRAFGMAMGPIELFDLIGTDTAMWAGRTLWEAFPDRISPTPVLPALVKRGRLGLKSKRGFYRYDQELGPTPDPDLTKILEPYIRRRQGWTTEEITQRLFLPMLVEAARVIEEKVVDDVRDIDIGMLYGIAFPESRGGLLHWADSLGAKTIVEMLKPYESLGKRMHPTALLLSLAASGQRFYDPLPKDLA